MGKINLAEAQLKRLRLEDAISKCLNDYRKETGYEISDLVIKRYTRGQNSGKYFTIVTIEK